MRKLTLTGFVLPIVIGIFCAAPGWLEYFKVSSEQFSDTVRLLIGIAYPIVFVVLGFIAGWNARKLWLQIHEPKEKGKLSPQDEREEVTRLLKSLDAGLKTMIKAAIDHDAIYMNSFTFNRVDTTELLNAFDYETLPDDTIKLTLDSALHRVLMELSDVFDTFAANADSHTSDSIYHNSMTPDAWWWK